MGAVPSTPRKSSLPSQDTAEYLIGTFVGEKSFPLGSDFWQKLLELPLTLHWPTHRVYQACELFAQNNYSTRHLAKILIHLAWCLQESISPSGVSSTVNMKAVNAVYISSVFLKFLIENAKSDNIEELYLSLDESEAIPNKFSRDQNIENLVMHSVISFIGTLDVSPSSYLLHHELLNFMLVAMSTQLLSGPSPGPKDVNPFIDATMQQTMLLTTPDCFSSSFFSSFRGKSILFSNKSLNSNSPNKIRIFQRCKACLITSSDAFEVGRLIGSYGFMNITSYSGFQSGSNIEYTSEDMGRLKVQDVGEGSVKIRLYEGRIAQGPLKGTPVIFKVYPGQRAGGIEADMMAANELNAHAFLQISSKDICQNLQILLGGFETKTGEQWLAFRNNGKYSAADYAKVTSERMSNRALAKENSWNPFELEQTIKRKRYFVLKLLQGAISGLAYMHDHDRLHQSLGPASVVLNTIMERDAAYLVPRLRDLAFSVDIRYSFLEEGPGTLSEALWRRASAAGAFTPMEKRAFGIADDIYEAGLLFAYLAFVPFCEAGIMDGLSLQRLLESTFQLDLEATREYCLADDRLLEAVNFLDLGDGAGWELLQAMLNPDFRKRPIAEAVLSHRFMTGAVL